MPRLCLRIPAWYPPSSSLLHCGPASPHLISPPLPAPPRLLPSHQNFCFLTALSQPSPSALAQAPAPFHTEAVVGLGPPHRRFLPLPQPEVVLKQGQNRQLGLQKEKSSLRTPHFRFLHSFDQEESKEGEIVERESDWQVGSKDGQNGEEASGTETLVLSATEGEQIVDSDRMWATSSETASWLMNVPKGEQIVESDRLWANISKRDESIAEAETDGEDSLDELWSASDVSSSSSIRPTLVYDAEGVAELSSDTSGTDESDLSELELEAEAARLEEHKDDDGEWTDWGEEDLEQPVQETEDRLKIPEPESLQYEGFSDENFTTVNELLSEDWGEDVLTASSPHSGHQYLHELSIDEITEILGKARAKDVRVLQVGELCEWADQLVFASGRSARHLRGMADALVYKVKKSSQNVGPNSLPLVEGREGEQQWMVVDCGSTVVHLLLEEARSYYDMEEFWERRSNPRRSEA